MQTDSYMITVSNLVYMLPNQTARQKESTRFPLQQPACTICATKHND